MPQDTEIKSLGPLLISRGPPGPAPHDFPLLLIHSRRNVDVPLRQSLNRIIASDSHGLRRPDMSTVANDDPTRCLEIPTLLSFLSNHLILQNTAPYLTPRDRLALAASSKSFRDLLYHTPGVFRHLDLTPVRSAQFDIDPIDNGGEVWRNVQLDENLTEDEYGQSPLNFFFVSTVCSFQDKFGLTLVRLGNTAFTGVP